MVDVNLSITATVPTNTSGTVTVREQSSGHTQSQTLEDGTNSYTLTGYSGGSNLRVELSLNNSDVTATSVVDSVSATYDVVAPSAPQNVSAIVDANDQISLNWDAPSDWGGDQGNYHVQIDRDGTGFVDPAGGPTTPGSGTTSETYGPHNSGGSPKDYDASVGIDSSFQFRVRAENSAGNSSWTTSGIVYTDPIPPYNPSISRPDGTNIDISWTNISDIENGIEVQVRLDSGSGYGSWSTWNILSSGSTQVSYSLQNDSRYQFRIRTVGNGGNRTSNWVYADYGNQGNVYFEDDFSSGDASIWDSSSGSASVVSSLHSTFSAGDNTQSPETGGNAVQMGAAGWLEKQLGDLSGESDVIVIARVQMASNDNTSEEGDIEWYDGSTWNTLTKWGWEYDGQGWYYVTALVNSSWLSTDSRIRIGRDEGGGVDFVAFDEVIVSDILHEYTIPAVPSGLNLDNSVEDEITASWTDNSSFETGFDLEYKKTSAGSYTSPSLLSATSYTILNLDDGDEYEVRVAADLRQSRRGSTGNWWETNTISATAITFLPVPTGLSISNIGPTSADASWTNNHDYGSVTVQYKKASNSTWQDYATGLSLSTESETLSGLLNGEKYDVRILAVTEHTQSEDISKEVDFYEDEDLSEYTLETPGIYGFETSNPIDGSASILRTDESGGYEVIISTSGLYNYPSKGDTFQQKIRSDSAGTNYVQMGIIFGAAGLDNYYAARYEYEDDDMQILSRNGGSNNTLISNTDVSGGSISAGDVLVLEITWDDGTLGGNDNDITFAVYNEDKSTLYDSITVNDTTHVGNTGIGIRSYVSVTGANATWDDYRILR